MTNLRKPALSIYFANPDPYAKVEPRADDAPKREFAFDEKGNIVVKNPYACFHKCFSLRRYKRGIIFGFSAICNKLSAFFHIVSLKDTV